MRAAVITLPDNLGLLITRDTYRAAIPRPPSFCFSTDIDPTATWPVLLHSYRLRTLFNSNLQPRRLYLGQFHDLIRCLASESPVGFTFLRLV